MGWRSIGATFHWFLTKWSTRNYKCIQLVKRIYRPEKLSDASAALVPQFMGFPCVTRSHYKHHSCFMRSVCVKLRSCKWHLRRPPLNGLFHDASRLPHYNLKSFKREPVVRSTIWQSDDKLWLDYDSFRLEATSWQYRLSAMCCGIHWLPSVRLPTRPPARPTWIGMTLNDNSATDFRAVLIVSPTYFRKASSQRRRSDYRDLVGEFLHFWRPFCKTTTWRSVTLQCT